MLKNSNETMYSIGILWNMSNKYLREMMLKIAIENDVIQLRVLDLKDKYDEFVYECYKEDEEALENGYIYEKIKSMKTDIKEVAIFAIKIDNPTFILNDKGKLQCIEARKLKSKIRNEYDSKVEQYFFDNLIHLSDNLEEVQYIQNVIDKYTNYTSKEYIRKGYTSVLGEERNEDIKIEKIYTHILKEIKNKEEER